MLERLQDLEGEYDAVEAQLADPAVLSDHEQLRRVSKRHKDLTPVVDAYRRYRALESDLAAARELLAEASGDERELARAEMLAAETELAELEEQLKVLLIPADPNDGKDVIVEIRGAEGGEEANLFARDLFEMYQAYAARKGWTVEVLSSDPSDLGGLNQVTFMVKGDAAWSHLKFEGGPHRVQRVPVTESQGRIHTSSATVLVLPEAEEVDVEIDPNDLQIDVYRSSGPGGQGVNTTDSAVRITHKPSGIVGRHAGRAQPAPEPGPGHDRCCGPACSRSEQDEHGRGLSAERRSQVGGGGRGEKIRTYNFKENRVTDHRIGLTLYRLQVVLAGDLDEVRRGADGRRAGPPARRHLNRRDARWRQLLAETAEELGDEARGPLAVPGGQWPGGRGVGARARRARHAAGRRPARRHGGPAAERRTAPVRARALGLPPARPARRPPGADPAAGDGAGRRGRPRAGRRAAGSRW